MVDILSHIVTRDHTFDILEVVSINAPIFELLVTVVEDQMPPHVRNVFAQRLAVLADVLAPVSAAQGADVLLHEE